MQKKQKRKKKTMDKKNSIKNLRAMLKINPDISAEGLIQLADYYVDVMEKVAENETKIIGDTVRIQRVGDIVVKEYDKDTVLTIDENKEYYFKGFEPKTEREKAKSKALKEYKQKFLEDIEKLKKERGKNGKNNTVDEN